MVLDCWTEGHGIKSHIVATFSTKAKMLEACLCRFRCTLKNPKSSKFTEPSTTASLLISWFWDIKPQQSLWIQVPLWGNISTMSVFQAELRLSMQWHVSCIEKASVRRPRAWFTWGWYSDLNVGLVHGFHFYHCVPNLKVANNSVQCLCAANREADWGLP